MLLDFFLLIILGVFVGTIGTLIGAGGGFILVPVLILLYPDLAPEEITAISLAIVAMNATVGSSAYIRARRVDFKSGLIFALGTVPGSIVGVHLTRFFDRSQFDLWFGIILITLAIFLFVKGGKKKDGAILRNINPRFTYQKKIDKEGRVYEYSYNLKLGFIISVFIGFFSPLFGIGGGIIHVPAMTEILYFPVHIATATSQFVLGIMALISVITHIFEGSYNNPEIIKLIGALGIGIIPGSLLGAKISEKVKGKFIVRVLSFTLIIIGIRIAINHFL